MLWGHKLQVYLIYMASTRLLDLLRESKTSRELRPPGDLAHMNWTATFLTRQECGRSLLGAALAQMETDAGKRRLLQTLAGTYPCRSLLHRWGRADSAQCPLCGALSETCVLSSSDASDEPTFLVRGVYRNAPENTHILINP